MDDKKHACSCGCDCKSDSGDDVIVCRCEEVYLSEIKQAIKDGAQSLSDLRRLTRAGMGLCQGRNCGKTLQRIYAQETGTPLSEIEPITARPPVRPIPMQTIGTGTEAEEFDDPENESDRKASAYTNEIFEAAYGGDGPVVL